MWMISGIAVLLAIGLLRLCFPAARGRPRALHRAQLGCGNLHRDALHGPTLDAGDRGFWTS